MHSNISTTDGIYGTLSNADKKRLLSNFNPENTKQTSNLDQKLDEILSILKQNTPNNLE